MIARRVKQREGLSELLRDGIFIGGGVAIVWGIHFLSIPGAWIAGGVLAMYLAFASAPAEEPPDEVPQHSVTNRSA
jgi:hypothetical protein